ncbi:hypothetical protein D4740_01585 [Actinomyces sp. 2119]|uniref:DUF7455 domain-containing protein n=2 Tax=Actinomycetaceae TaxID=2049 RepID=A0ABN5PT05_9ACTO|nr:hypothetical protein D5R93_07355 [Actinomyces lilanjuaniae]RJF44876.1 hypothetical protein D4740_01585 [Actinomyces sp. 2119]
MSTTTAAATEATAAAPASTTSTDQARRPLTTADRCDACGAQAYVRVVLASGELLFCAHHGRAHADALQASALFVQDESDRLLSQD